MHKIKTKNLKKTVKVFKNTIQVESIKESEIKQAKE